MIPFKQAYEKNYAKGRGTKQNKYIVLHYTANNGDTAKNNVDYYSRPISRKASAHYYVDETSIWQSVKDEDIAYHCGTGNGYKHKYCRNSNSLGVELCSRKYANGKYYFKPETVERAAGIVAYLANKYNIPDENIIRHYDVTGKNCPAPMVENPEQWTAFKERVKALRSQKDESEDEEDMKDYPEWAKQTYKWIKDMPEWAQSAVSKAVKKGIVSTNADNSVTVLGINLQTLVWMERAGMLD